MASSAWLKSRGVKGKATVRLAANGLEISGDDGGLFRINPAQVRRIRTNWVSVKYGPFFLTRIWLEGDPRPLKLHARGFPIDDYAAVIRSFAAQLSRTDGVTRLQRGSSIATALEVLIPMAMLFVAAVVVSLFALDGDELWQRLVPVLVVLPFVALGIGLAVIRWPRQVKDLAEFNKRVA